jgi:hypothetical protein
MEQALPAHAPIAGDDEPFDISTLRQDDMKDAIRLARQRQRLLRMVVVVLPDLDASRPAVSKGTPVGGSELGVGASTQQQQQQQKGCPGWVREYMRDMLLESQQVGEVMVGSMFQVMELLDLMVKRTPLY